MSLAAVTNGQCSMTFCHNLELCSTAFALGSPVLLQRFRARAACCSLCRLLSPDSVLLMRLPSNLLLVMMSFGFGVLHGRQQDRSSAWLPDSRALASAVEPSTHRTCVSATY